MSPGALVSLLVLGLASYRVTRLVVLDTIVEGPRLWLLGKLATDMTLGADGKRKRGGWKAKVSEGLQCSFCVGVWVTLGLCALWHWWEPSRVFVGVAAVAGLQALVASWEGD